MSNPPTLSERLARHSTLSAPSGTPNPATPPSRESSVGLPTSISSQAAPGSSTRKRRSDEEAAYDASHVAQKLKLGPKDKATLTSCAKVNSVSTV